MQSTKTNKTIFGTCIISVIYLFIYLFIYFFRATSNIESDLPADGFDIVVTKHNYIYTVRSENSSFS